MILRFLAAAVLAPVLAVSALAASDPAPSDAAREPVRVFIFAGQSNMVGSDSKVRDIERFPPFEHSLMISSYIPLSTRSDQCSWASSLR